MIPFSLEDIDNLSRDHRSLSMISIEERVDALRRWANGWTRPVSDDTLDDIAQASGLSPAMIAWGARTTAEAFARDLDGLIDGLGGPGRLRGFHSGTAIVPPRVTGHVWASTLPTSGWIPVLGTLLIGGAALIKAPAAAMPAAAALIDPLAAAHPACGRCLAARAWAGGGPQDALLARACDALVVSGGRDAIARFALLNAERPDGPAPLLPFGPGRSCAVIPASALPATDDLLDALALDVAAYDQRGCLSPQALWVEIEDRDDRETRGLELCARLAAALDRVAAILPRGDVPEAAAAAIMQRRGTAAFRGRPFSARDALVLWEPTPYRADNPLHRTLPVHPFEGGPEGLRDLIQGQGRLHSLGVAGDIAQRAAFAATFAHLGISRVCAPGAMQTPPGDWHHDGLAWLSHLARFVDLA